MNFKAYRPVALLITSILSSTLMIRSAFAMGSEHPNGQQISSPSWPAGVEGLVNTAQRVGGYWVNARDVFFFSGHQKDFESALAAYMGIQGITEHKLVIHDGVGRAKAPWDKGEVENCDWMIDGCIASWKGGDPNAKGYVLEFHVWTGGGIKVKEQKLPKDLKVEHAQKGESCLLPVIEMPVAGITKLF